MSKPGQTHSVRNRHDMPAGIAPQRLRHPRTTRPTTTSHPSCSRSRPRCRAKAAGNESVDGRMTACDDEIGRLTTTQQPTNERRVRTTTMATATARWAAARRDTTAMATGDDDDNDDDDGATTTTTTTMATARRATGYDDGGNDNGGGATGEGI
jgi:hypothetical protein